MPSFDTHYAFGIDSLKRLPNGYIKNCCRKHSAAYALGNQGPDSCFFFTQAIFHKKMLGRQMHTTHTGLFLQNMFHFAKHHKKEKERSIMVAYLAGFLGHYALDTMTHPFIYARTDFDKEDPSYSVRHATLETDLDFLVVRNVLGILPSALPRHKLHWLSGKEVSAVRKLFMQAAEKTYPEETAFTKTKKLDFHIMPLTWAPFHNKSGRQKKLFQAVEKMFHLKGTLSSQIPEDHRPVNKDPLNKNHDVWVNPWDETLCSTESFTDLYKKARKNYLKFLYMLEKALASASDAFRIEPSLSYLSGLDCTIPY